MNSVLLYRVSRPAPLKTPHHLDCDLTVEYKSNTSAVAYLSLTSRCGHSTGLIIYSPHAATPLKKKFFLGVSISSVDQKRTRNHPRL